MLAKPQGGKADFAFIKEQLSKTLLFSMHASRPFDAATNPGG